MKFEIEVNEDKRESQIATPSGVQSMTGNLRGCTFENYNIKENKKFLKDLQRGRGMQISVALGKVSAPPGIRRKIGFQTGYLPRAAVPP